jgi:hypothetical protein
MTPRVSLAVDAHVDYAFYAPLTVLAWAAIGYGSTLVKVDWTHSPHLQCASDFLDEISPRILTSFQIDTPKGYRSCNVAQIARLYATVKHPTYCLTSDIDMWPIDTKFFVPPDNLEDLTLYYANNPTRYPICYVGAGAATWASILDIDPRRPLQALITSHMTRHLSVDTHPQDAWQHDEEWLTARIWDFRRSNPGPVREVLRAQGEPPTDRLDRSAWPSTFFRVLDSLGGVVDAHLPRPGHTQWGRLRPLFGMVCPNVLTRADQYVQNYLEAVT